MRKHTPGPWIVDPDYPNEISPADDLRMGVASICNSDNINGSWVFADKSKANAHLIAAAPDLLDSLIECLPALGWQHMSDDEIQREIELGNGNAELIQRARSAIAKALGE